MTFEFHHAEMPFQFRTATLEDVPAIRELIAASVRGLQQDYSPEQREAALATVFTVDSRLIADGTYLVAFAHGRRDGHDGRLAACGGWSRRSTLYGGDHQVEAIVADLLDPARDAAKIRAIFVHPEFARQGLGSAILERAEQAAKREGFHCFEMGSTLTGVPLYALRGYRRVEEIEVPVGNGTSISVVRMEKRLNDLEQQQKKNDDEDEADGSATVVADAGAHAIAAKAEEQD